MININANLIEAPVKSTFMRDTEEVSVANFTLVKRYGKGKEYIHFNQRVKEDKTYRNFIVKSFNKIESKEESEEE